MLRVQGPTRPTHDCDPFYDVAGGQSGGADPSAQPAGRQGPDHIVVFRGERGRIWVLPLVTCAGP